MSGSGDGEQMVKRLPGGPWDEAYVLSLLREEWDVVIANGFRYTLVPEARVRTEEGMSEPERDWRAEFRVAVLRFVVERGEPIDERTSYYND